MEPGKAVFQVLVHVVPYGARGLELARSPGRVIGFHPLSITPGTDIGFAFDGDQRGQKITRGATVEYQRCVPGLFTTRLVFLQHRGRPRFGGPVAVKRGRAVAGARISPGTGLGLVSPVSHAVRACRPLACTRYIRPIARKDSVSAPG